MLGLHMFSGFSIQGFWAQLACHVIVTWWTIVGLLPTAAWKGPQWDASVEVKSSAVETWKTWSGKPRAYRGFPDMTSKTISDLLPTHPPYQYFELIYTIWFTQPPLLHPLFHEPPSLWWGHHIWKPPYVTGCPNLQGGAVSVCEVSIYLLNKISLLISRCTQTENST